MIFEAIIAIVTFACGLAAGYVVWGIPLRWLKRSHKAPAIFRRTVSSS